MFPDIFYCFVPIPTSQRLWPPPGDGDLFLVPGTGDISRIHRLDGGGQELVPGKGGEEEDDKNSQKEGGGAAGVHFFL